MATVTALTHEKVWFEKPSYDKAERLYFERMAKSEKGLKVMYNKIIKSYSCNAENSINNKHRDLKNINASSKSETAEKSKNNNSLLSDIVPTDILKQYKCQVKNSENIKKEDECNITKMENLDIKEKCGMIDIKKENINSCNDNVVKCTSKKIKEELNEADTRNRNKGKGENVIEKQIKQMPNKGDKQSTCPIIPAGGSLSKEVAKARQHIKESLKCMDNITTLSEVPHNNQDVGSRIATLEKDNQDLRNVVQELRNIIDKLEKRVKVLEEEKTVSLPHLQICPAKPNDVPEKAPANEDDDEDVDLFGSGSEDEDAEAAKIREERLAAYAAKKSKKPALIAKSNIILDVKPWDEETDMKVVEAKVREIECNGLLWGASKLVHVAFGIYKLQISCVVEDDKVSVDWLTEKIQEMDDYVQSVDIAAFNKI